MSSRIFFNKGMPLNGSVQHDQLYKPDFSMYELALSHRANKNNVIILISTDFGFINQALNLYITSLRKFNITNFLYVTSDKAASSLLDQHNIPNYLIFEDRDGKRASKYRTKSYTRKTHIKTKIILQALKHGFTVLIVDADIVFLKNPLPFFSCSDCDIQMQWDGFEGNTGFYLVRPTKAAIDLHSEALAMVEISPKLTNQETIDRALEAMQRRKKIKMVYLPETEFPNGRTYFELGQRMFAGDNPCKSCVIVHNNWIVSGAAKEYRFKEHLLWFVDTHGYYSDPNTKYITYRNPYDFGTRTTVMEIEALKGALSIGHLLNRIVILPAFHCHGFIKHWGKAVCSLNTHINISAFDAMFSKLYREHTFLQHPYVPAAILSSQSQDMLIKTKIVMQAKGPEVISKTFSPADPMQGATSSEIVKWFQPLSQFKVLPFHSLYGAFYRFDPHHINLDFETVLNEGVRRTGYRQI